MKLESLSISDPSLLRAAPLSVVLRRGGRLFANSAGSAETYELSRPVKRIHTFLSHNWAVRRLWKFLVLAMHFNFYPALAAAVIAPVATIALIASGLLPVATMNGAPVPICSLVSSFVAFWLVLFFGHRAGSCFSGGDVQVFLDKVCIHQTDDELKRASIEKLGAFLQRSSSILIVYTDLYLDKLWTVYEMASYLACHRVSGMHIFPTIFPKLLLTGKFIDFLLSMLIVFQPRLMPIVASICILLLVIAIRWWAREQARFYEKVGCFDIKDTHCFNEGDRVLVEGNVVSFMRHVRMVAPDASAEDALAAFNGFVRREMPGAFKTSIGITGWHYWHVLAMWLPQAWVNIEVWTLGLTGNSMRANSLHLLGKLVNIFALGPLYHAVTAVLLGRFIKTRGVLEVAYGLLVAVLGGLGFSLLVQHGGENKFSPASRLMQKAETSDAFLLAWCAYNCALFAATAILYNAAPRKRGAEQTAAVASVGEVGVPADEPDMVKPEPWPLEPVISTIV